MALQHLQQPTVHPRAPEAGDVLQCQVLRTLPSLPELVEPIDQPQQAPGARVLVVPPGAPAGPSAAPDPDLPQRIAGWVSDAIAEGRLTEARIDASVARLEVLKARVG